jgi:hypothetical protein
MFGLTGPLAAQQQAGDTELQLQGSLNLVLSGDGTESGSILGNYGRFLNDTFEVGGTVGAFFNADGDLSGIAGPFVRYNFSTGTTLPYVGSALVGSWGDFSSGDFLLTGEAGVRWFLQRNVAFTVAATTHYDIDASDHSDFLQVQFGFSYLWGD